MEKNYLLEHGKVIVVDKIDKKEENHKSGLFYSGIDYKTNDTINVLNKDAWKSAELIRIVMQKKNKMPLWLLITLLITWIITTIIVLVIVANVLGNITWQVKTPELKTTNTSSSIVVTDIEKTPIVNDEKKENINENESEILYSWYTQPEYNFDKLQADYTIQELTLELQKKDKIINDLELEKEKIKNDKNILLAENENLKSILEDYKKKKIFYDLGKQLDSICDTNENIKPICKDLYFNLVKND